MVTWLASFTQANTFWNVVSNCRMGKPTMGRPSVMVWTKKASRKESQMSWGGRSSTSSNASRKSGRESQFKKDSFESRSSRKVSDVAGIRKESLLSASFFYFLFCLQNIW